MLDLKLANVIARVESSHWSYAMRYEPSFRWLDRQTINTCAQYNRCDLDTAQQICKTSYGFYQIMGENLYAQGLQAPIAEYLNEIALQYNALVRFLTPGGYADTELATLIAYPGKLHDFARYYNGPGNPDAYAAALLGAAKNLGYVVGTPEHSIATRSI